MIDVLGPYPAMKDSGVPWLGKVPAHWDVQRLGALGTFSASGIDKKTVKGEPLVRMVNYLDIYKNSTHTLKTTRNYMIVSCPEWKRSAYAVRKGDMLFTPSSETVDEIGLSAIAVENLENTVYSYHVIRFRPTRKIDVSFGRYWCNNHAVLQQFSVACKGTTRKILTRGDFRDIVVPIPPSPEQTAIAEFLAYADRRIRRYIHAKQQLIALLDEQKQVTIQRLVTEGFQEQLPFDISGRPKEVRDSKDWLCATVGHLIQRGWLKIQDGNHGELHPKADDYVDDGIPFLMANDIRASGLNFETCAKITEKQAKGLRIGFAKPGDVLLTHKATIGQVGIVPGELPWPFLMLTPQVTYYRCKLSSIEPLYLFAYMQTAQFQQQIAILSSNQSTRNYIGILEQRNLVIPIPNLETQAHIIREFQTASKKFDATTKRARQEIELLREYRSRLIADVVTGKLDVRGAAAGLPQEAQEVEPLDEIDDMPQDESTADEELDAADAA